MLLMRRLKILELVMRANKQTRSTVILVMKCQHCKWSFYHLLLDNNVYFWSFTSITWKNFIHFSYSIVVSV